MCLQSIHRRRVTALLGLFRWFSNLLPGSVLAFAALAICVTTADAQNLKIVPIS